MEWINPVNKDNDDTPKPVATCGLSFAAGGVATCVLTGLLCDSMCAVYFG